MSFAVTHFSGAGGGSPRPTPPPPPPVTSEESALEALAVIQEIQSLAQQGQIPAGDPTNAIADILRAWYDVVVAPALSEAGTDDSKAESAIAMYARWEAAMQWSGVSTPDLQDRASSARNLIVAALQHAIAQAKTRCRQNEALAEAAKVLRLQQMAEALGLVTATNGLSLATVRAALCVQTALDGPTSAPQLKRNQTTTISFEPRVQFQAASAFRWDDAGRRLARTVEEMRQSGPSFAEADNPSSDWETEASAMIVVAPIALFRAAPEIPFYVTTTIEGATTTSPLNVTTAPGDDIDLSVTPIDGTASVRVVVQACMRAPNLSRLDDVCERRTETYEVESQVDRIISGNVTILNTAQANALSDVVEITGNLQIGNWGATDAISLTALSRLRRVGGEFAVLGGPTSVASLTSLREVGVLVIGSATLTSLHGLEALETVGDYVSIGGTRLTSLAGLEGLRHLNSTGKPGYGFVNIGGNPQLADVSTLSGLVPAIKGLGLSNNPALTDVGPIRSITSLPLYLSIAGPEWTTASLAAAFPNLSNVGDVLVPMADQVPNLDEYSLPALTRSGSVNISTDKQAGMPSRMTRVVFPALTTVGPSPTEFWLSGQIIIQGQYNGYDPGGYVPAVTQVLFPALVTANGVTIENTTNMAVVNLSALNTPGSGGVVIRGNVGMPAITIGHVRAVSIDNAEASAAPRNVLDAPFPAYQPSPSFPTLYTPHTSKEDLTKITIASVGHLTIFGAQNWTTFGPAVGQVRQSVLVECVEVPANAEDDLGPNVARVCGWVQSLNIAWNPEEFPHRLRYSIVWILESGKVSGPMGFSLLNSTHCTPAPDPN